MREVDYTIAGRRFEVMIRACKRAGRYVAIKDHIKNTLPQDRLPADRLRLIAGQPL